MIAMGEIKSLPPVISEEWIWLRHERCGLRHEVGSDWDCVARDTAQAGRLLERDAGAPDLCIERQYVAQRFYAWGQIDFLPVFEWNGLEYLDRARFFPLVVRGDDGLFRPCLAHDALICWMTQVLWGARYRRKYDCLLGEAWAADGAEFRHCLEEAFGKAWADQLGDWLESGTPGEAVEHAKALRRALFLTQFMNSPGESLARQARHWWTEARHHLNPPYPWVAILGPDGSGKSSVIDGLTARLSDRRLGTKMIHWSPRILRKGKEAPGGIVPDPHSGSPRGRFMSVLKLGLISAEWYWASIWNLRHPRAKSKLLVSDRYYNDLLVDPRRYRFGAPLSWARAVFRFLPKPDHVIVLAGDADRILARKREVAPAELRRQLAAYRALAGSLGDCATVVDCGLPLDEVIEETCEIALKVFRERNRSTFSPPRIPHLQAPTHESVTLDPISESTGENLPDQIPGTPLQSARLRVLVSAYGCSPHRGSEANVAWNLIRELSASHEIWVMTRAINEPVISKCGEPWVAAVQWIYFDPPPRLTFWRRGKRGISLFYAWWQILARKRAKRLMSDHEFDIFHHITIGTYLFPSLISDLGVPLVFGPVGGGDQTPPGLGGAFRRQGAWEESMRKIIRNSLRSCDFLHHFYVANAWTLAATPTTETALRELGVKNVSVMTQSALGGDNLERFIKAAPAIDSKKKGPLRLVTACRLVHWKAVDLVLEAVALAHCDSLDLHLTILEKGPEFEYLRSKVKKLKIGSVVTFAGRLDTLEEVYQTIRTADALVHPALHEAFGQAVLESLGLGVPVICLNWGGPGIIVDETCGYKIEPGSRTETVKGLAAAIGSIASDKKKGRNFSEHCVRRSRDFRWDTMACDIEKLYSRIARPKASDTRENENRPGRS